VVDCWVRKKNPFECSRIHQSILRSYRQDFGKYAKNHQIKYVELLFETAAQQLSQKFKFNILEGSYRKRELSPALGLLAKAGIIHHVYQSNGQGIPIGATANREKYKVILLDVGLTQSLLGLELSEWFLNSESIFVNKGALVEAFVGQELLVYQEPYFDSALYFWQRNVKGSEAEVDYLIQMQNHIIPIEVKSDKGRQLKSMHLFLNSRPETPFGIRFSSHNYSVYEKIFSYPLYAIPFAIKSRLSLDL
jgi:predicted AAA+ superfamily ATPase